jgi:hypothetical protein
MVSNPQPAQTPDFSQHPKVQEAGLMSTIARTLAGNPTTTVIDPQTGVTTRTPTPLTGRQIALAIALQALGGAAAGAGVKPGPGNIGRAAAAGFGQAEGEVQQRNAQQEQRAQEDAQNEQKAYNQKAVLAHLNGETGQLAAMAHSMDIDALQKIIDANRASGVILDSDDPMLESRDPLPESEILKRMSDGTLNVTTHLGSLVGMTQTRGQDGTMHVEGLYQVVSSPTSKVAVTPDEWNFWRAQGVRGIPAKNPDDGVQLTLSMKAGFANQAASHALAQQRLDDLKTNLTGTPSASSVPASIDWSAPGVDTAFGAFKRYVSHDAANSADPYLALQQMGSDKRDPKTGALQPNPDSKYVNTIAQAYGGWNTLLANHNQLDAQKKTASDYAVIDSADKADAVLAAPKRFTQDQVTAANRFNYLTRTQSEQKASEEARAHAIATGADVEAMYRFGRNPITGEVLSIQNAPDAMLVGANGMVIPQDLISTYKPTAQEKQTADTARAVLEKSAKIRAAVQANPNLAGPLAGRSKQLLAKAGLGDAQSQEYLDDISFLQSAATKMHTGRFSVPIIEKMNNIIQPGMNVDQFSGALNSIDDIAKLYAKEDQLITVGDLKQTQNRAQQIVNSSSGIQGLTNIQVNPKTGQRIGWDGTAWVDATTRQAVK